MNKAIITYNGIEIEVEQAVADYLETERRREQAEEKSDKRHLSDKDIERNDLDDFVANRPFDFVDEIANNSEAEYVRQALEALTDTQKRRVYMYFFDNLNCAKIAKNEGVSEKNIRKSIYQSLEKIKYFFM